MALETRLYQKLSQQLVMTPQLRQAIKILQVSRAELEQLIDQELTENPVLEEGLEEVRPVEEESRTDEQYRGRSTMADIEQSRRADARRHDEGKVPGIQIPDRRTSISARLRQRVAPCW